MNADELRVRFANLNSPDTSDPDPRFGRLDVLANWLGATGLANAADKTLDRQLVLFVEEQLASDELPELPWIKISQHPIPAYENSPVIESFESGIQIADQVIDSGTKLIFLASGRINERHDVEILIGALLRKDAATVTSLEGANDQTWMANVIQIRDEIFALSDRISDPLAMLAHTGSLDVAAMIGLICQAAKRLTAVVLVGDEATCAALIASRISHVTREWVIPAVDSTSPAGSLAQHHLDRPSILQLGMKFGRDFQTPIAMAAPIIDAILKLLIDGERSRHSR